MALLSDTAPPRLCPSPWSHRAGSRFCLCVSMRTLHRKLRSNVTEVIWHNNYVNCFPNCLLGFQLTCNWITAGPDIDIWNCLTYNPYNPIYQYMAVPYNPNQSILSSIFDSLLCTRYVIKLCLCVLQSVVCCAGFHCAYVSHSCLLDSLQPIWPLWPQTHDINKTSSLHTSAICWPWRIPFKPEKWLWCPEIGVDQQQLVERLQAHKSVTSSHICHFRSPFFLILMLALDFNNSFPPLPQA